MKTRNLLLGLLCAASLSSVFAQTTIYSDSFSGDGTTLNGATTSVGGGTWSTNNFVNKNGTLNLANEGSALLPFEPVVDSIYTLSMSVQNTGTSWVGLGFARDALIAPGTNNINDRLSNEPEGISWLLYRDSAVQNDEVQIFGGLRTAGIIADTNPVLTFNQFNTLKIVINTTGTGANFTANFFINDVSLLSAGPVTIARTINDINFVGFSYDNTNAGTVLVDNFSLTAIPEPSTYAALTGALALGAVALRRRR